MSTVVAPPPSGDRLRRLVGSTAFFAAVLVLLVLYVTMQVPDAKGLRFSQQAFQNIGQILTPVVLMSLFIERATEVIVTSWRNPEAQRLQHEVDVAAGLDRVAAQRALDFYRLKTQRIAFLILATFAVLTAMVGLRAVEPLLVADALNQKLDPGQVRWFHLLDIVVTGLLMAGGADGIHQIVSTFTAFLDSTRDRAAAPAGGGGGQAQAPMPAAPVQQNLAAQNAAAQGAAAQNAAPGPAAPNSVPVQPAAPVVPNPAPAPNAQDDPAGPGEAVG
jgi:hypothetical protein